MAQLPLVLGVDWCAKEGWVAVALREGRYAGISVHKTFAAPAPGA